MSAMIKAGVGLALGVAGFLYAHSRGIGFAPAAPVIAAFLITYPFYLAMGFRDVRERMAGPRLPWALLALAVLPYLACCAGAIPFQWGSLARLAALALAMALWYRVLPVTLLSDLAFLAVIPAVVLTGFFDSIYPPYFGQKLATLGHITLIPMAVLALILERRAAGTGLTYTPTKTEWRIGVLHYFYFLPVGAAIGFSTGAFMPHPLASAWRIAGTFIGFLWVIGLSEEFFFRGVLQQWVEDWTNRRTLALILVSAIFGAIHIWSRLGAYPAFPNWRWGLLAAALGWFCGRARNQANSIGASTVTHALVVATWRAFLG